MGRKSVLAPWQQIASAYWLNCTDGLSCPMERQVLCTLFGALIMTYPAATVRERAVRCSRLLAFCGRLAPLIFGMLSQFRINKAGNHGAKYLFGNRRVGIQIGSKGPGLGNHLFNTLRGLHIDRRFFESSRLFYIRAALCQ